MERKQCLWSQNTGDLVRIQNQHVFIHKVIKKVKSPSILIKLLTILRAISKYIETNMSAQDILSYGWIFAKTNSANIKTLVIQDEAKYIGGVSYFLYDEKENLVINSIIQGNGLKGLENNINLNKSSLNLTY